MYYLMRDDLLTYLSATPEGIVAEINSKLANFRTYGGLNFEVDGLHILVRYGKLSTNLKVRCEKEEDVAVFQKTIGANY
jgi:hypothetical protein